MVNFLLHFDIDVFRVISFYIKLKLFQKYKIPAYFTLSLEYACIRINKLNISSLIDSYFRFTTKQS